jgi:hypothetical protein
LERRRPRECYSEIALQDTCKRVVTHRTRHQHLKQCVSKSYLHGCTRVVLKTLKSPFTGKPRPSIIRVIAQGDRCSRNVATLGLGCRFEQKCPAEAFVGSRQNSASIGEALRTFLRFKGPMIAPSLPHPSTSTYCSGRRLDISNMSTTSAPAIRHTLRSCASPLRSQKRWAQVHDVRFVATHQDTNKIIDRYKEKLAQKAKECAISTHSD